MNRTGSQQDGDADEKATTGQNSPPTYPDFPHGTESGNDSPAGADESRFVLERGMTQINLDINNGQDKLNLYYEFRAFRKNLARLYKALNNIVVEFQRLHTLPTSKNMPTLYDGNGNRVANQTFQNMSSAERAPIYKISVERRKGPDSAYHKNRMKSVKKEMVCLLQVIGPVLKNLCVTMSRYNEKMNSDTDTIHKFARMAGVFFIISILAARIAAADVSLAHTLGDWAQGKSAIGNDGNLQDHYLKDFDTIMDVVDLRDDNNIFRTIYFTTPLVYGSENVIVIPQINYIHYCIEVLQVMILKITIVPDCAFALCPIA
jgi:hypothetical protein